MYQEKKIVEFFNIVISNVKILKTASKFPYENMSCGFHTKTLYERNHKKINTGINKKYIITVRNI